jgi:gas vesicle protein
MATTINHTMDAAKHAIDAAREAADQTYTQAKDGTEHAATAARSTFFDGVNTVVGLAKVVRSLTADDALGWVGLARRPSAFSSFALFGAGLATGAAAALLFAPMTGEETRKMILKRLLGAEKDIEAAVKDGAKDGEKKIEETAKDIGTKAKDVEAKVEKKVEKVADKVEQKVEPFKDTIAKNVRAFGDAMKDGVDDLGDAAKRTAPHHRS